MGDYAIQATGLSKRYRIGLRRQYNTLRDSIVQVISSPARMFTSRRGKTPDTMTAPSGLSRIFHLTSAKANWLG